MKNLTNVYKTFVQQGFDSSDAIKIINDNPMVLRYRHDSLSHRLEIWRGCHFGEKLTQALIKQCPELLDFDDELYVRNRMADLKLYAGRGKNMWRLLMASPNLMVEDLALFRAKCTYIEGIMRADVTDAVKSGIFSCSLRKIRTRHMFMVRLGIYKERTKNYSELDTDKNPRLFRIMNTNDATFAKKICDVSLLEYETFSELYRRELRNNKQLTGDWRVDDASDEDEDTDDEDSDEEEIDVEDDPDYQKDFK